MNEPQTLDPSEEDGAASEAPLEPEGSPDVSEAPPDSDPEPEPEPPSREADRIADLTARNRQLEQAISLIQQQMAYQQAPQAAPSSPFNDPSLPPEWRQSLETTDRYMAPVIQQRVQQMLAPVQQQLAQARALGEAANLARKYPDFHQYEATAMQAQQQFAQQSGGTVLPLETIYKYLRGEQVVSGTDRAQQERRATARAKGKVGATTAQPVGTGTARGRIRSPESIAAMTDAEILAESERLSKLGG